MASTQDPKNQSSQSAYSQINILDLAFLIGFLCLHAVLFMPSLTGVFEVATLSGVQLGTIYCLSFMPFLVNQWYKALFVRS